jgi:hypothetical protein
MILIETNKPPRRRNVEHAIQVAVMDHYKLLKTPGALLFAIPLGGARNKITGKMLKDEGATAGVPDLWGRALGQPGFWLELKRQKGRLSEEQDAMHLALHGLGERVFTVYGLDEALAVLKREGVILQGRVSKGETWNERQERMIK